MRILIVTQYFWPENFRINDLTQELVKREHTVTVLTGVPNYPDGEVFDAYRQNTKKFNLYEGACVLRVPMLSRGRGVLRLAINYLSFVLGACICGPWRLRGRQFDVIFVFQTSPVTVGIPAVMLGQIKSVPIVFWVLDLWPESLAAVGVVRSRMALDSVGRLVEFIYKRCTLVLGQSRGFVRRIAKYCSDPAKIRYFPNWAEVVFDNVATTPAPEVLEQEGFFNVLFAGNIGEAQDLPAILLAAESLKHNATIRWLIVGDGRKFDWLQNEVKSRGLQSQVLLLGRFPVERMPSFYMHAGALLVSLKKDPAFSLTVPGKVQSYLLAGVPLIGMLDGEGARVIEEANAGLVCAAGDSSGLAAAVLKLAAMPVNQRKQLGANGRVFSNDEFGRSLLMERLEKMLFEAVDLYKQARANGLLPK